MLSCPVCRSTDVYEIAGGYIGQVYRCKACGYRGSFIVETADDSGLQDREKHRYE